LAPLTNEAAFKKRLVKKFGALEIVDFILTDIDKLIAAGTLAV
jgi:hypothetical protein